MKSSGNFLYFRQFEKSDQLQVVAFYIQHTVQKSEPKSYTTLKKLRLDICNIRLNRNMSLLVMDLVKTQTPLFLQPKEKAECKERRLQSMGFQKPTFQRTNL